MVVLTGAAFWVNHGFLPFLTAVLGGLALALFVGWREQRRRRRNSKLGDPL
jgi:ABC-type Mn2+/Zn2+ transport system permease subunit